MEFANVLKTACTRGKLEIGTARQIVDTICALPIEIDQDTPGPRQLFELAMRHGLSIACQDGRLREASKAAGVTVL